MLNTGYVSVRWICRKRQCKVGTVTLVDRMKRVSGAQSSGIPTGAQPSGPAGAQSSGAGMPMPNRPSGLVGGLLVDHWTEYWIIERRLYHWTEYWITGRSVESTNSGGV